MLTRRAAEVRAKIGRVGTYMPQKGRGGSEVPQFSLTINFDNGQTEQITATTVLAIDLEPAV